MRLFSIDGRKLPKPHNSIVQAVLDLDEVWFRANPSAKKRVRTYRVGELGPGFHFSPATKLLIVRLEPFIFIKIPINGRVGSSQ